MEEIIAPSIQYFKKFPQTTEAAYFTFIGTTVADTDGARDYITTITETLYSMGIIKHNSFDGLVVFVSNTTTEKLMNIFNVLKT